VPFRRERIAGSRKANPTNTRECLAHSQSDNEYRRVPVRSLAIIEKGGLEKHRGETGSVDRAVQSVGTISVLQNHALR
jgi:hypothetical protein